MSVTKGSKALALSEQPKLTRNSISHPDTPISYQAESSTNDQRKGSIIMSNKQKEEKVIEKLEKEGKLKKNQKKEEKNMKMKGLDKGYNCV